MPARNRVSPFGAIEAAAWRGSYMGNRGKLALDGSACGRWPSRAWITCTLHSRPGRSTVRSYTKLFFSDEAAALAAGFRPCAQCRREAFDRFRRAWADADGIQSVRATEIDARLHQERHRKADWSLSPSQIAAMPDGVFVAWKGAPNEPLLVLSGDCHRWREGAYERARGIRDGPHRLITPPATVAAIRGGYRPEIVAPRSIIPADCLGC